MGKLSQIPGRTDDDADEAPDAPSEATTTASAQPEGDAKHPPAAMPADVSVGPTPGDAPPAYATIQEYEETLDPPDALGADTARES